MFDTDPLDDHVALVETVEAAGIAPPQEWQALRTRLRSFGELADQTPQRDQLVAAVVGGADANVPLLRALALAEVANHAQTTTIVGAVRNAVLARMRELYDAVAADNYASVGEKFDTACKRFVTVASTVDVEADPVSMIEQPDKVRRSWLDAEAFGNAITKLLPAMAASARLAGIPDTDSDSTVLPLVADLSGVHKRRAWEAWVTTTGRCNRWGALLKAGAVLRACPLDEHQSYTEPRPMETREEHIRDETGRVVATRRVPHDPEDSDAPLPAIDPRKPQKRVMIV